MFACGLVQKNKGERRRLWWKICKTQLMLALFNTLNDKTTVARPLQRMLSCYRGRTTLTGLSTIQKILWILSLVHILNLWSQCGVGARGWWGKPKLCILNYSLHTCQSLCGENVLMVHIKMPLTTLLHALLNSILYRRLTVY